jgi:hypothetical protein
MKYTSFFSVLTFVFLAGHNSTLIAGNTSGGGGDNIRFEDTAAWFNGSKNTIQACAEVSTSFGVPIPTVQLEVERAFQTWKKYISDKRVFTQYSHPNDLTTSLKFLAKCDGNEDLKLYMGVSNQQVEAEKKRYHNPTAFVARTSFHKKMKWAKGFVWIASHKSLDTGFGTGFFPDWQRPNNLQAILLHEIGHIYGCDHVSGTIMTAEIGDLLGSNDSWKSVKESIDNSRELYRCDHCAYYLETTISIADKKTGWTFVKKLIGREPEDFAKVRIKKAENSPVLRIEISDSIGAQSFRFLITSTVPVTNDGKVFQTSYGIFRKNYSAVSYGHSLETSDKRVPLTLEYNLGDTAGGSPLVLNGISDGSRVELATFLTPKPDPTR